MFRSGKLKKGWNFLAWHSSQTNSCVQKVLFTRFLKFMNLSKWKLCPTLSAFIFPTFPYPRYLYSIIIHLVVDFENFHRPQVENFKSKSFWSSFITDVKFDQRKATENCLNIYESINCPIDDSDNPSIFILEFFIPPAHRSWNFVYPERGKQGSIVN